jgi:hypothetical protein
MAATFKACSVDGCNGTVRARGYCGAHYHRMDRYGDPLKGAAYRARHGIACSVEGCRKPHEAHGYCVDHYRRWRKHGDPLGGGTVRGAATKFLRDIVLAYDGDDCLIWPFSQHDGYGKVGKNGQMKRVHRMVCVEVNGPPPTPDHDAAHSCGRGRQGCVTKGHLSWKTRAENEADKLLHDTHIRGERNGMAKLSQAEAETILAMKGKRTQQEIADMFGIDQSHVSNIHRRKVWAWLDGKWADQPDLLDDRRRIAHETGF